ncbi:MAG: RsmE family RNA methyltransferase [Byssovorax sp.]
MIRVPCALLAGGDAPLSAEAATYVTRVHRLAVGDAFLAFDPERSTEADAELIEIGKRGAVARIGVIRRATALPARAVTLIQGACKGDKMDAIVRDATELGATRIIPAIAARSVARPDAARADRWRRIAVEAARQCGRGDAPTVEAPALLPAALALVDGAALRLCLDPTAAVALGSRLGMVAAATSVAILVGPEGGLDGGELDAAERAGFERVRLGGFVLRTETVCAAVLGALVVWSERDEVSAQGADSSSSTSGSSRSVSDQS